MHARNLLVALLLVSVASVATAEEVRYYEKDGVTYREVRRRTQRPLYLPVAPRLHPVRCQRPALVPPVAVQCAGPTSAPAGGPTQRPQYAAGPAQ